MNLPEARQALADAVSTLDGVTCTPRPVEGNLRLGDAYVTVGQSTPGPFLGSVAVTLSAFVNLGSDEPKADEKVEALTVPLIQCVEPLYASAVTVRPQAVSAGDGQPGTLYQLALTATFEVSE